jgi:hypothetical protein
MALTRIDSGSFGSAPNRNTDWIGGPGFWLFYALLLLAAYSVSYVALYVIGSTKLTIYAWTAVNIGHAVVTFYIMHWFKGVPYWLADTDPGRYDKDTFWEQIDNGRQYTLNRKLFSIVPLVLFALAVMDIGHGHNLQWLINFVFSMIGFIPKLGAFYHVRILGINKD